MNLDELQSIRDRERQSDSLQQLRESFYADAGEFVQQLRDEREAAAARADDPFDAPEVNRLTDDIKTAEQTVEAIYERRVGKLVKMASFAAADMPTEDEGLTAEERELFEQLVASIEQNRDQVFDILDGAEVSSQPTQGQSNPAPTAESADAEPTDGVGAADLMSGESETSPTDSPTPAAGSEPSETERDEDGRPTPDDTGQGREPDRLSGTADPDRAAADTEATTDAGATRAAESTQEVPPETPPGQATEPDVLSGETGAAGSGPDGNSTTDTAGNAAAGQTSTGDGAGSTTGAVAGTSAAATGSDARDGSTGADPKSDGGERQTIDRTTVRITRDVGEILGVDEREYDLSTEDVVTLPATNADPLVERDAAERLE